MKKIFKTTVLFMLITSLFLCTTQVFAQTTPPATGLTAKEAGEWTVTSPSECGSSEETVNGKKMMITPRNCLFLEEPIGGKTGYDLYVIDCVKKDNAEVCTYKLWRGGAITGSTRGPVQAVLTEDKSKPYQGPFTLLYNYLGLIYKYMSGVIVGVGVLFVVIGGIQMTTAGGDQAKFDAGKSRIVKAIVGIILWFTASLILYTINPTFFAF